MMQATITPCLKATRPASEISPGTKPNLNLQPMSQLRLRRRLTSGHELPELLAPSLVSPIHDRREVSRL